MDTSKQSPTKKLWPVCSTFGFPLLLIALNATPLGPNFVFVMLGIPILLGIWVCLGVWASLRAVLHLRHREWLNALLAAVLPLVILVASVWHWQFLRLCNDGGDMVYFMAMRSALTNEVNRNPPDGEPRLLVFNRGGMIWASRGYVYDESDEVIRDEPLRSAKWNARVENTELTCGFHAEPFPGGFKFTQHWYLASFAC